MADWDLLLTDVNVATMAAGAAYAEIPDAAVGISAGCIDWVGPASEAPARVVRERRRLEGRWLTPALIDCHTHLVFAGNRATEFEKRLNGATYEEIAAAGGGIVSTVKATRDAGPAVLTESAARRLQTLKEEGVGTVEIKSGYGLDIDTEKRMLETARRLADAIGVSVTTTFLGAHTTPGEFRGRSEDYIRFVCEEALPAVHEAGLVDAVDAYLEPIAFNTPQVQRVFEKASELDLPVKLHADQLSDGDGAALAASFGALSADHLEYTSAAGVAAMASAGTVATLLPGAFVTLREKQLPPVDELRRCGVPIALGSDLNPGTSPVCSIRAAMNLATHFFRLTPAECLAGVTREAARALGLATDRGTVEAGKRADLAVWDIDHPGELSYWLGLNPLNSLYLAGERQQLARSLASTS